MRGPAILVAACIGGAPVVAWADVDGLPPVPPPVTASPPSSAPAPPSVAPPPPPSWSPAESEGTARRGLRPGAVPWVPLAPGSEDVRPADRSPEPTRRFQSPAALAGGIVLCSVGGLSSAAGVGYLLFAGPIAYANHQRLEGLGPAGAAIGAGVAGVAIGVPLILWGVKRVGRSQAALPGWVGEPTLDGWLFRF